MRLIRTIVAALALVTCFTAGAFAQWQQMPGAGRDVGIGGGAVFVIGTNPLDGGYGIYRWNGNGWNQMPGAGFRIAADSRGTPWVVNTHNSIYVFDGMQWQIRPGAAVDIGVGGGAVWVIGTDRVPGGYGIYRWNGRSWDRYPGAAVRITVDDQGTPWVVNDQLSIYRWAGNAWQQMPGLAHDIGAGGGQVWVIGATPLPGGYSIHRWAGNGWQQMPGAGTNIAVDGNGVAWVTNAQGNIYRWGGM